MLAADTICLRPPEARDLPFFVGLRNDLALQLSLMAVPRPNPPAKVAAWLEQRADDPHGAFFVIADAQTGDAAGFVQLTQIDTLHGTAELGICLAGTAQGRGFAAEAMRLLEQYARQVFNLRKFVLRVLQGNQRAVSFYDRIGFRRVGTLQQHHYQDGAHHDVLIMEKGLTAGSGDA